MATIEKRGDSYRITVSVGYDMTGKQIKKRKTWTPEQGMTDNQIKKELQRQAVLFEERCRSGQVLDSSIRFSEFADYWMTEYAEKQLRPSTVAGYKRQLKRINAAIGNIRLDRLQPNHLIGFYNALETEDSRRVRSCVARIDIPKAIKRLGIQKQEFAKRADIGERTLLTASSGEPVTPATADKICAVLDMPPDKVFTIPNGAAKLSGTTRLRYHRLISSILEKAVRWQIIFSNPCKRLEPPKADRREAEYLDEVQAQQLIQCLQAEPLRYRTMITLLLYTGMRRGELCGLEWSDIDFDNRLIDINKTSLYIPKRGVFEDDTKTQSSKRIIKVPDEALQILKEYQTQQNLDRFKLGDQWIDSGKVFTQWNGKPIHPDTITGWFAGFIKKNDLPPVHLHSLRHTNATLLIAGGADLRTVSKRLGHSNMTTTSNIYAHAIKSADERAAELLGDLLNPMAQHRA